MEQGNKCKVHASEPGKNGGEKDSPPFTQRRTRGHYRDGRWTQSHYGHLDEVHYCVIEKWSRDWELELVRRFNLTNLYSQLESLDHYSAWEGEHWPCIYGWEPGTLVNIYREWNTAEVGSKLIENVRGKIHTSQFCWSGSEHIQQRILGILLKINRR